MNNLSKMNVLLLLKWIALNSFIGFLAIIAIQEGYVSLILDNDVSNISYMILGIFMLTMALIFAKVCQIGLEIKSIDTDYSNSKSKKYIGDVIGTRRLLMEALRTKYFQGVALMSYLAALPITAGLIGTIVGFIIMFQGIPETGADNAAMASQLTMVLTKGMGVALYTTLAGSIMSIWLQLNNLLMKSGLEEMFRKITKNEYSTDG